jgi:hypothetical protein
VAEDTSVMTKGGPQETLVITNGMSRATVSNVIAFAWAP